PARRVADNRPGGRPCSYTRAAAPNGDTNSRADLPPVRLPIATAARQTARPSRITDQRGSEFPAPTGPVQHLVQRDADPVDVASDTHIAVLRSSLGRHVKR